MQIKFDVFWTKNLGTLYKDNSVDTLGKEAKVSLDLKEVLNIYANFKVGENSFTDSIEILDIENRLIRIPFKSDVLKEGLNEFEIVAVMKNGDVLPSQTYSYKVDKSLQSDDSVKADTNYPILVELIQEVDSTINKVDTYWEEKEIEIDNRIEEVLSALPDFIGQSEPIKELKTKVDNHEERLNILEDNMVNNTRIDNLENKVNVLEPKVLQNEKDIKKQGVLIDALFDLTETISITEEGNVISLPQSKDGTVMIEGLEGNTLVNYCKNGDEELTLNNEINVQGTDVTLTDTVNNGKVDVILEGNTLILDEEGNEVEAGTEGARLVSVGELEDNKIEVTSRSKNLFDTELVQGRWHTSYGGFENTYSFGVCSRELIKIKPNTTYQFWSSSGYRSVTLFDKDKKYIKGVPIGTSNTSYTSTDKSMYVAINLDSCTDVNTSVQLEEGTQKTSYVPYATNTHSIQLSEPLRGLPNGVCDKFVKQGGKWYVERNCGELKNINNILSYVYVYEYNLFEISKNKFKGGDGPSSISNKLQFVGWHSGQVTSDYQYYITRDNNLWINLPTSDKEEALEYLKDIVIVGELKTPTYEEITDPQVITYLDTTYISTNSTIPCNMKVKNSGYDAIIKPNTQYTVAFDTNKSGEVNIDLGGAKTLTTNNVATITTPSTLTDDTLRLYGKGIKTSNVRLLEGDKTNYIPSFFEGMKSCFEDKLQDDETYKVEIISSNLDNSKSNKIQLFSIEPLRAVGDVKDRFVLKDDKLMIERNCGLLEINSSQGFVYTSRYDNGDLYGFERDFTDIKPVLASSKAIKCDKHSYYPYSNDASMKNIKGEWVGTWSNNSNRFVIILRLRTKDNTPSSLDEYLSENPISIVYQLKDVTYEEVPFELQKIILEGYENGTLFFDTNIPPTSTITYSANKPVVAKLNQVDNTTNINTEDIAITQMAVDFLLMSSLGEEMINFKLKGGTNMSAYFASRIIKGALKYEDVIRKYPNYKEDIDLILVSEGYSDLIIEL